MRLASMAAPDSHPAPPSPSLGGFKASRSVIMATPVALAIGEHLLFADPATRWEAQFSDTNPPSVVLTASIATGPTPPMFPGPARATTLVGLDQLRWMRSV